MAGGETIHCPDQDRPEPSCADRHSPGSGLALAVVATHPVQYQCPVWRRLAQSPGIGRLKVLFASDFSVRGYRDAGFGSHVRWGADLLDGYDHEFFGHGNSAVWHHVGRRAMVSALVGFRPDACLVNAYLPLAYLRTIAACGLHRIPVVLRAEATDADRSRSSGVSRVRDAALRVLYGRVSAFAAIGCNARDHYLRLGVDPARIVSSPYCVDSPRFAAQARVARRGAERSRQQTPADAFVVLFPGKLIPKKDPTILIRALRGIPDVEGRPIHVWFLGDGELRSQVEGMASSAMPGRVRVLGFRPQEELGAVYVDSDVVVLPSVERETWGLVVNEALAFGVPCVVSDRVGCAPDLVAHGVTGAVFAHGDPSGLRDCLLQVASWLRSDREVVGRRCRERVAGYSVDAAADGIIEAANVAVSAASA
jgi:glycosyltransferase involved in cell wall biosynthesis